MASTISTPAATNINVVATTAQYPQKSNLKEQPGSWLTQATILVFDDIVRAQGIRFTHGMTQADYDLLSEPYIYAQFEGNVKWFMDELVGMESDWNKYAAAPPTPANPNPTAYGYVQFTEDSVDTAAQLYINHINRFNARSKTRVWNTNLGTIAIPAWLRTLRAAIKNGTYVHKVNLNFLSYDQVLALALIHMHGENAKDFEFIKMGRGEVAAAKGIYLSEHYKETSKNPATPETLKRLNVTNGGFFKIHYVQAVSLTQKIIEHTPAATLAKAILEAIKNSKYAKHIETVKGWFGW
jgi:hypothetical protein